MSSLIRTIGARPYWQGYTAPSTAFISTDLAQITMGELTETELLTQDQSLPDIFDLLVEINPIKSSLNPTVTSVERSLSAYAGKLANFSVSRLILISQDLWRIDGIIQKAPVVLSDITGFEFQTLMNDITVTDAPDTVPLGGFWGQGCELSEIRQYHIIFYRVDDEIHYNLHPKDAFADHVRDRKIFLKIPQDDDVDTPIIYESVDCQRHGTKGAWITFQKQS